MIEVIAHGLAVLTQLMEIIGASILVIGFVIATTLCFKQIRQQGTLPAIKRYRKSIGRTILIGLEILS